MDVIGLEVKTLEMVDQLVLFGEVQISLPSLYRR
jgi:hypothetical protein